MGLEALYQKLPICLQNALCSAKGWRLKRSRFGAGFRRHLQEAEERIKWSEDRMRAFRDEQLQAFIGHCASTVPYYRRTFKSRGIDPRAIRSLEDLKQLPVLTKEEVQNCYPEMLSEAVPPRRRIMVHSSGTTGGGLRFASTRDALQQQWAVWWRYRRAHGIHLDTWSGHFGGRSVVPSAQKSPPFWRHNLPGHQILFSGYHMSTENLTSYIGELRRQRPPWLHGYPSLLALVAAHLIETGGDLGYAVGHITVGAENLLPQQSDIIHRAFGVRPRQHYGLAEAVTNISECENAMLHVDEDFAAVEFIPNDGGPGYRVICTNFTNPATPLLRYDTQDVVSLSDAPCSCGRPGRVVQDIDGRREDYVVLRSGARVGRMDHVFKDLVNIREAQIHQRQVGTITVRVVRGGRYSDADERQLLAEMRQRVGDDTEIRIEYTQRLQRSPRGKLRLVLSDLKEGQLVLPHAPDSETPSAPDAAESHDHK